LLENEVDHVEHFYFLALVVPDLVGHLQLQEHIFEDELNVGVEVAVVFAIFGEVVDDSVDNFDEANYLHQQIALLHELFLALAQLPSLQAFVAVVDAVFLSLGEIFHSS
jgi:hypothetical protein